MKHDNTYTKFSGATIEMIDIGAISGITYTRVRGPAPIYAPPGHHQSRHGFAGSLIFEESHDHVPYDTDVHIQVYSEGGGLREVYMYDVILLDEAGYYYGPVEADVTYPFIARDVGPEVDKKV